MLKFECPECGRLLKSEKEDCPNCTLFESGATQFRMQLDKKVSDVMGKDVPADASKKKSEPSDDTAE
jgi:hypothetical protein